MADATCQDCGAGLTKPPKGFAPRWCRDCYRKERSRRKRERERQNSPWNAGDYRLTKCQDCGEQVRAAWKGQIPKRCAACRRKEKARIAAEIRVTRNPKPAATCLCVDCGTEFPRRSLNGPFMQRCPVCAQAHTEALTAAWRKASQVQRRAYEKAWRARNREKVWLKNHRRRAVRWSVEFEVFTHDEIFERDGWTCQMCGVQINRRSEWPDLRSASLDHIVPISRGGPHTRANVRLACLGCNLSKGAKLPT